MTRDVRTVAWKEWKEYLQHEPGRRLGPLRAVAAVAAGGIFLGWQIDPAFGHSPLTVLWTMFMAVMFVTSVIPDSFAGERERHTLETLLASRLPDRAIVLGKVTAATSYGVAMALAVLPAGVLSARLIHGSGGLPAVDPAVLLAAVLTSLLVALLIADIGVLLSLHAPTVRQANQRLGLVIMALFMTPAIVISAVPRAWWEAALAAVRSAGVLRVLTAAYLLLVLVNLVLLAAAMRRFHRGRLIA